MATELTLFELSCPNESVNHLEGLEEAVEHGEVFTRRWVVELILDLAGYVADRDLAAMRAIEPACGSGAFLVPMVERLVSSSKRHGRSLADAVGAIHAYDLVRANVLSAREAVETSLALADVEPELAARLTAGWVSHGDYLLSQPDEKSADFVIGNPPYVRLEAVPAARQAAYRRELATMGGRADIFVGFYELGLRSLVDGGALAFICADRWMRNSYGRDLRRLVARRFSVDFVLSLHDVDAFEEPVSAYPAITVLRRREQSTAVIADTSGDFGATDAAALVTWADAEGPSDLSTTAVTAARIPRWFEGDQSWPTGSPTRLAVLADLERHFPPLEDQATGTRVGIGVATGADSVFVTYKAPDVEEDRQLPLAMTADIRSGVLKWSGHYLASPWGEEGLVRLDEFPKLRDYYLRHQEALRNRNIASRQPHWYRTIDRVHPSLTSTPKLLFADMSMRIWPVLDEGSYYPHHNLYWVTSQTWDLRVLGGLLLSDIAELFVSAYCVRMRGGTLRFQAQYLRRIRVPLYSSLTSATKTALSTAFEERDVAGASELAASIYGVEPGLLKN